MKPENKSFLEANRHHWITLRDAQYCRHMDGNTREGMRRVMAEEFQPGYSADLWCPPCVVEMVKSLYRHYDDWLARQEQSPILIDDFSRRKAQLIEDWLKRDSKTVSVLSGTPEFIDLSGETPAPKTEEPAKAAAPVQVKASFPNHKQNRRR